MFEFTVNKAALLSLSLLFTSSAMAMEISADKTRTVQEFTGNVMLKVNDNESVTVSADSVRKRQDGMEYSGKVTLSSEKFNAEADEIKSTTDGHGTTTFTTDKLTLISK
ncbi:hypothetical protein [Aeromonas dhakensis]|uniref:hypothetical protein n=1 Tax=Aeromonas dhakensis TaxID=196024 RepID=UPI0011166750|nr:hypothetical protein [Aeromonas dhakensis]MBL0532674.1 hypothetical protein [Aeromonas dhakensis]TNI35420.1 hypothetical protein CF131_03895 [Aeromonas dhakensis]TNI44204.1 hypothetical protein CF130_12495 [Aeromonas dhakensis]